MKAVSQNRIAQSFARRFHSYHQNATQQAQIAQHLITRLQAHTARKTWQSVFEFGCGTGHLTQALRQNFEIESLILNDLIKTAQSTAQRFDAQFISGDIQQISWPKTPDLIVSASTLQWIADPIALFENALNALAPQGWIAVSSFGDTQFHELRALGSQAQAPSLYAANTLASALQDRYKGQIEILEASENIEQIWFETPRQALLHLRDTGVNANASQHWSKTAYRQFCRDYQTRFETAQGVPLTYHPVWLIIRRI